MAKVRDLFWSSSKKRRIMPYELDDFLDDLYYLSGRAGRSGVNGPVRDRSLRILRLKAWGVSIKGH
jgi:hypothetical protein